MVKKLNYLLVNVVLIGCILCSANATAQPRGTYTKTQSSELGEAIVQGIGSLFKKKDKAKKEKQEKVKSKGGNKIVKEQDDIELIVTGDGETKDEATKVALRSAIEQTYGTFVSSNTRLLNDEQVKDEIVTVSSGNVKSYNIINENERNGRYYVTVDAIVSIGKLISYVKSKGAEAELAGASFAMDIKMKELNRKNQDLALKSMTTELTSMFPTIFDYKINVSEPKSDYRGKNYRVSITVSVIVNKNVLNCYKIFHNTLDALTLSMSELNDYKTKNLPHSEFSIVTNAVRGGAKDETDPGQTIKEYVLRGGGPTDGRTVRFLYNLNQSMLKNICNFKLSDSINDYIVSDVTGNYHGDRVEAKLVNNSGYHENISSSILGYYFIYQRRDNFYLPILADPDMTNKKIAEFKFVLIYNLDDLGKVSNYSITPLGL